MHFTVIFATIWCALLTSIQWYVWLITIKIDVQPILTALLYQSYHETLQKIFQHTKTSTASTEALKERISSSELGLLVMFVHAQTSNDSFSNNYRPSFLEEDGNQVVKLW